MATSTPTSPVTIPSGFPGGSTSQVKQAVANYNAGKTLTSVEQQIIADIQNWNIASASSPGHIISQATVGTANSVADIISLLTSLSLWTRVGEVILGAVLLILGLRSLTGDSSVPSIPHLA